LKTELLKKIRQDLSKAIGHLEYSLAKSSKILKKPELSEDDLESLEGFGSRFARASDIAIQRFLRFKVLEKDPAFRGSVIDTLNESEKFGWIDSAREWTRIRELRNVTAHEYTDTEVRSLYTEMVQLSAHLVKLRQLLP
jgi:hypothetical protein